MGDAAPKRDEAGAIVNAVIGRPFMTSLSLMAYIRLVLLRVPLNCALHISRKYSQYVVYRTDAVFAIQGDLGAQSSLCGGLMNKSNDGVLSLIQTLVTHFYILWAFLDVSGFPIQSFDTWK